MSNILDTYYQHLCSEWGFVPTANECSGYEHVIADLRKLNKQAWASADDAGKLAIEQEVFDIYRKVNILPIVYYSLDGCKNQIHELATKTKIVQNRTLGVGNNDGQSFARFWFPNMQDAKWNTNDTVSLRSRFNHDVKLKRAINLCYKHRDEGEESVIPRNLRRAIDLVNGGTIQNFKPMNARAIWEYICPTFRGHVLDFSSGYGGRMLGAMTSNMQYHYTGIDPNTKTAQGLEALGELIHNERPWSSYNINCLPSEEFDPITRFYDAAFSSPPYFNLETYTDETTQCMNRYTNVDRWFEGYVEPTLKMIHRGLDTDGIYAVNIADYKNGKEEFKIVERWKKLSEQCGFEYIETVDMMLNVRPGVGNNRQEKAYKSEGIYIFRKKSL